MGNFLDTVFWPPPLLKGRGARGDKFKLRIPLPHTLRVQVLMAKLLKNETI